LDGQKERDGKGNNTKGEEDKDMKRIKEMKKNLFFLSSLMSHELVLKHEENFKCRHDNFRCRGNLELRTMQT
jgi:hypothetical protein